MVPAPDEEIDDNLREVRERTPNACAGVQSLDQFGTKWRLRILYNLFDGDHRFNELKRASGASSYTLSRVLESLEEDRIVDRRVEEGPPVATHYSLTEKGAALEPVFAAIDEWNAEWVDETGTKPTETTDG
ncbi:MULTISPECIES: helix-turn-helix domain-containing protein [Natrinema]|uniref:Transcriptional regulator n=1 Tax=Natrinema gari JCM 14663 TaxID=1230459 RepID=L9ZAP0_9EURY|nr:MULTISPECIES: helix-turn-helix domain-containing protein [Natrinema]AFO57511.1 transcriptional regulator [Natrinema sp. J7-2]ELY83469.1 transcriptional regulator [Natrinema gari JCM 14663]